MKTARIGAVRQADASLWPLARRAGSIVVLPADSVALADAMRILVSDEAMALRMGEAARKRAAELFSSEKMASAYVALYEKVTHKSDK